jgi:phosphoribosylanthranilate isomerase
MIVKICGITNVEDALEAARAGADAVGLVFSRSSARHVDVARAAEIVGCLPPEVLPVGVFVNVSFEVIDVTIRSAGIRCVQLHGEETPALARRLRGQVWKSFRISPGDALPSFEGWSVGAFLLDSFDPVRRGGTGHTTDWDIAARAARVARVILAGGLRPGNVAGAVRLVRPYGVDVSSGVESGPGKKDPVKMRQFVAAARGAWREVERAQMRARTERR